MLLQRLRARFPTAQCTSARRLFASAYMIMSKVIWEDTYSNKSWRVATQEIYSLREINQMEREMCGYVDWELTVDNKMLSDFEMMVTKDYSQDRTSYPNYPLTVVSKRAAVAAAAKAVPTTSTPDPNVGQEQRASSTAHRNPLPPLHSAPSNRSSRHLDTTSSAASASSLTSIDLEGEGCLPFTFIDEAPPVHPLRGQMYAFSVPSVY